MSVVVGVVLWNGAAIIFVINISSCIATITGDIAPDIEMALELGVRRGMRDAPS